MKPAAIPALQTADAGLRGFAEAAKHNLDMLTGQHRNLTRLAPLAATASTTEIIERLNVLLARLQGDQ